MANEPRTLQEAIVYFSNPDNCLNFLVARRWKEGVACPTCGRKDVTFVPARRVWQCKTRHSKCQFSVKVGTIFEDSPISLDKWLTAMWMEGSCKNGISSHELMRTLGITQKTAWFMLHRIRLAMQDNNEGGKLSGEVEVDETFIGGKARNMHSQKRKEKITGRGPTGKAVVMGMLERGGKVRAAVIDSRDKATLHAHVNEHVAAGSNVFTDELISYWGLDEAYVHEIINHAEEYVRGNVHTNGMENFWSLLKRGLNGTYVSVEPFHLFRYIDEQAFRYNYRKMSDAERFNVLVNQVVGKRLTYADLTGNDGKQQKAF
jgi:transposase-like protein